MKRDTSDLMWIGLWIISMVLALVWLTISVYMGVKFDRNIGGHLKRAADASDWSTAMSELDTSIKGMENAGLTKGYTSLVYQTPNEDIGFWYNNIKTANDRLHHTTMMTAQAEDMALIKLRQVLLDKTDRGELITKPRGIARYPLNFPIAILGWISILLFIISSSVLRSR